MYTEKDFQAASREVKRRACILAAIFLAAAGLLTWALVARYRVLCYASVMLGCCAFYFYLMLKLLPWISYWKFLRDMRAGRSRVTEGWFVSLSDQARLSDGVAVHEFILRIGDKEEDERLFFFDDDKPLPRLEAGQRLRLTSYGNYITGCEQI